MLLRLISLRRRGWREKEREIYPKGLKQETGQQLVSQINLRTNLYELTTDPLDQTNKRTVVHISCQSWVKTVTPYLLVSQPVWSGKISIE